VQCFQGKNKTERGEGQQKGEQDNIKGSRTTERGAGEQKEEGQQKGEKDIKNYKELIQERTTQNSLEKCC
jgi:hypothetical protein